MKYAIVNGIKTEATKGAKGFCPGCKSPLIAKCGETIIHHWAHKGNLNCDHWWENETPWHRSWKNNFSIDWQEIVHMDKTGEKHIADVKTDEGWVLEFQHSFLNPEERRARNTFYPKLVWIVDGKRRETDIIQFQKVIRESTLINIGNLPIHKVTFPEDSRLLKEWMNTRVPVFFDFQEPKYKRVWFLLPHSTKDTAYLLPFSTDNFIQLHNKKGFNELALTLLPKIQKIARQHEQSRLSNMIFRTGRPYRRRF